MKLITLDVLLNKSFSFKCLKTSIIHRSKKCFHHLIKHNIEKTGLKYDDVIVYVFDNIDNPFFVILGNGSYYGALQANIQYIYYYTSNELYSLFTDNHHYAENRETICKSILNYYTNNNTL